MQGPQECRQGIIGTLQVQRTGDRSIRATLLTESQRILIATPAARAARLLPITIALTVVVSILIA
jgi:hypothetical protein